MAIRADVARTTRVRLSRVRGLRRGEQPRALRRGGRDRDWSSWCWPRGRPWWRCRACPASARTSLLRAGWRRPSERGGSRFHLDLRGLDAEVCARPDGWASSRRSSPRRLGEAPEHLARIAHHIEERRGAGSRPPRAGADGSKAGAQALAALIQSASSRRGRAAAPGAGDRRRVGRAPGPLGDRGGLGSTAPAIDDLEAIAQEQGARS